MLILMIIISEHFEHRLMFIMFFLADWFGLGKSNIDKKKNNIPEAASVLFLKCLKKTKWKSVRRWRDMDLKYNLRGDFGTFYNYRREYQQ